MAGGSPYERPDIKVSGSACVHCLTAVKILLKMLPLYYET